MVRQWAVSMVFLFQLLVLGVFGLLAVNIWNGLRRGGDDSVSHDKGPIIDGTAEPVGPGRAAAETLRAFENARSDLKAQYPAVASMVGGYLNAHTFDMHGGVEGAVMKMIEDWAPRADEVQRELTRLLAENEAEEDVRAIILALCDADFEEEGYRKWATWLLGRFNAL